jgi:hypothetical protein
MIEKVKDSYNNVRSKLSFLVILLHKSRMIKFVILYILSPTIIFVSNRYYASIYTYNWERAQ